MPSPAAPPAVAPLTPPAVTAAAAQAVLDAKTKPLGALGRLERLAVRLAVAQRTLAPRAERARVVVFAADHGVAAEGVSAYPSAVTGEMVRNFAAGGAAVCVLARAAGCALEVVDVGVDAAPGAFAGPSAGGTPGGGSPVVDARVRRGSRNLARGPAMTADECDRALDAGRAAARRAADDGAEVLVPGEMGIGNTTSAAALVSALTGAPPAETVGRGTGVDDVRLARKRAVVEAALARHALAEPLGGRAFARRALERVGGLEIAAMAGATIEGARRGLVVVVDGYIATAAALAAARLDAAVLPALVFAHRSAEPGHGAALDAFVALGVDAEDARPLLDLGLRLGEGTGGVLALPLLRAAARVMGEMATFAGAGVSTADVPAGAGGAAA
jgi:nicotinate-nucleotide--dimethylbenzimidazole phosphoribosyltransferase